MLNTLAPVSAKQRQESIRQKLANSHVDVIIPTCDSDVLLKQCLASILTCTGVPMTVHIVNNGKAIVNPLQGPFTGMSHLYNVERNLGWIGGINYCKDKVKGPYVLFLNDDARILEYDGGWLRRLMLPFHLYDNVGAVGPTSNAVAGTQYINSAQFLPQRHTTNFLSGFCLLTRKDVLDEVGWLDESLSGGDDVDLSMRLLQLGRILVVARDVFVIHQYGQTGKRLYGSYWDSADHYDNIQHDLIAKHGLKAYLIHQWLPQAQGVLKTAEEEQQAAEVKALTPWIGHGKKGLNVGCGFTSYPGAVNVDLTDGGTEGLAGSQIGRPSSAHVTANVEGPLPFDDGSQDFVIAEDILEHLINPLKALREWRRVLRGNGVLIAMVPDEDRCDTIVIDATHVHMYDEGFISDLLDAAGYTVVELKKTQPGSNLFVVAARRE